MYMYKYGFLAAVVLISAALPPTAAVAADVGSLEKVVIIGTEEEAKTLPGSGAVVTKEQMDQEAATDINQLLKTVPGVYIREDDGTGIRPNIGIRGATGERSGKITLLEDGILAAPAPYSNPAAYYFPTLFRMSGIEILKGAPLLRYGPQTTGGIVNLLSTPIPEEAGGEIFTLLDQRGSTDVKLNYGARSGNWGWLVETVQREGAGYKTIDRSNKSTGFDIADYVVKVGWQGDGQSLLLKSQYSEEVSDETYLGLTDTDFAANNNRRYGISSRDQMVNDRSSLSLVHTLDWTDNITSTTTLYRNDFTRNWYKLNGGGTWIDDANGGDATAQGILDGTGDTTGGALTYKNNDRTYVSQGVEFNVDVEADAHLLSIGTRLHTDTMDRYQAQDKFDQINGSLVYQSTVQPTGSNNRLEGANATSFWVVDDWQLSNKLNINLALRYEDVRTNRTQYSDSAARNTIEYTRSNNSSVFLPGLSATYDLGDGYQVLAGAHRGFSPLSGGAVATDKPEISDNFEFGGRYNKNTLFVEAIGFYSNFSNKAENCSLANPCSNGDTTGSYITGAAEISGIELQAGDSFNSGAFTIPVSFAYTYTKAAISGNDGAAGFVDGDRIKDVPDHIASLRLGLEHDNGWNNYAVAKYISTTCSKTGCNSAGIPFDETEALFVMDMTSHYPLTDDINLVVKAENIFNTQKIVSRSPDGARPNKPFTFLAGLKHAF